MVEQNIKHLIRKLELREHPEGGYYSEIYRSLKTLNSNEDIGISRNLATSIYFMLKSGQVSKLHKLKSDEIWYFHDGSPLRVFLLNKSGNFQIAILGNNIVQDQQPQLIIPADTIFGAEVILPDTYSLIGCAVIPGFDFKDFELLKRDELLVIWPNYKKLIERLT